MQLFQRVSAVIQRVRPLFQQDGGDIALVEITDARKARVRLQGNCVGCPSAAISLYLGVEMVLREEVPELAGVEIEG
jgi:Fe-S cluster biogenesis protein NfuA